DERVATLPCGAPRVSASDDRRGNWELRYFRDRNGLPRLLSLPVIGQEVAPGLSRLVAVASSGLFPQPLWISVCIARRPHEPSAGLSLTSRGGRRVATVYQPFFVFFTGRLPDVPTPLVESWCACFWCSSRVGSVFSIQAFRSGSLTVDSAF